MGDVRTVTVRLPEPLHRAVKVRCAERGDSLEGVARAAFVAYLERDESEPGSVLERAGVRPPGLVAREENVKVEPRDGQTPSIGRETESESSVSRATSPRPFRPDPKGGSR